MMGEEMRSQSTPQIKKEARMTEEVLFILPGLVADMLSGNIGIGGGGHHRADVAVPVWVFTAPGAGRDSCPHGSSHWNSCHLDLLYASQRQRRGRQAHLAIDRLNREGVVTLRPK